LRDRVIDTKAFATIGPNFGSVYGTWPGAGLVTGIVDSISSSGVKVGR
jgi:hypothetical protein